MKFITFNDFPGGIYNSQVVDVCKFFHTKFGIRIKLIAFVSLRTYFEDRKKIKKLYKNSIILPSFPGIENWKKNLSIMKLVLIFGKREPAITRGVFATLLALECKKIPVVCFDSRAAYKAEWNEYLTKESPRIASEMFKLEREALERSNFKIAVSEQLVNYWKENYGYNKNNHVVIPCTIDTALEHQMTLPAAFDSALKLRKQWGISENDVLLIFSGSSAGWQSLEGLFKILKPAFIENSSLKLLLLSKDTLHPVFEDEFPGRAFNLWTDADKVFTYLNAADYGLLYREDTVTNRVSSPVKFGEYLAAGLPVFISANVGDQSSFVKDKHCGVLFDSVDWSSIKRPDTQEKSRMKQLALTYFSKSGYAVQYKRVTEMK